MDRFTLVTATSSGEKREETDLLDDESDLPEADDVYVDTLFQPPQDQTGYFKSSAASKNFTILAVDGVPQYKTELKVKTIARVFGRKIKTKVPVQYRRSSKLRIYGEVTYPASLERQSVRDVEECGKIAAVAAVAGAMAKGAAGALVAFNASFQACILAKLGDKAAQVSATVKSSSEHGKWVPY